MDIFNRFKNAFSVLLVTAMFVAVLVLPMSSYALTLPFFGKIELGGGDETDQTENNVTLESVYNYRPSPQYYNSGLDVIEIRSLLVNATEESTTGQYEVKIYRFSELWDTKTHDITYLERTNYIEGQPKDETMTFTEEQLINIVHSTARCGDNITSTQTYEPPCYHDPNPEDENHPFGGFLLENKPVYVNISDEYTLAKNERTVYTANWTPEVCGYFQIVVQPFGYQKEADEEGSQVKEAYVRVRGCENGQILENGVVSGVSASAEDVNALPGTSAGFAGLLVPGLGLVLGGILMHVGSRSFKLR
jgi:hypothetical protein